MKNASTAGIVGLALAIALATGCATKKYVNTEVDKVNTKVDGVSKGLEATQERLKATDARIGEVDKKTAAAQASADGARAAAGAADAKAGSAAAAAAAVDKASRKLIYSVALSDAQGNFAFGGAALSPEIKARIDEFMVQVKANPAQMFFEIEGHTDNIGAKDVNDKLGLDRAEAVKRYLYEQHQIPLHKMSVISFGSEKPVAPNNTKDGRAANRRVVIKVLS